MRVEYALRRLKTGGRFQVSRREENRMAAKKAKKKKR